MVTSDLFVKEINYISDKELRDIVICTLNAAPECIQIIPASSSGKYHNKNDLITGYIDDDGIIHAGGLVNHIRAVTAIAHSLMDSNVFRDITLGKNYDKCINEEDADRILHMYQDAAIAACILHDCCKPDDTPEHHTRFDHPLIASGLFYKIALEKCYDSYENNTTMIPMICGAISSHMGKWTTSPYAGGVVLPEPKTGLQVFVHLCDYIASRDFIDFNFDVYDSE